MTTKRNFSLIFFGATFYFSSFATAGNTTPNKIDQIITTPGGAVFFRAGPQISSPACSAANEWAFQVAGPNASGGKAMLALILEAHSTNKDVRVYGTGTCDIATDRETVAYIIVNN